MKVTFVHHSCFCVEIENKALVFDYFPSMELLDVKFQGDMPEYTADQEIYVFSSHKHKDHFDLEILQWAEKYPKIQYILSKDIKLSDNYLTKKGIDLAVKNKIHYMAANEGIELDGMKIETLLSTDAGVAFLVSYAGKTVYHAGDLHWWHWEGEPEEFNKNQEETYKQQMEKLKNRMIDLAFVVIDYRLEEAQFLGMDYFLKNVEAKHVIPMHLWQKYELIGEYKKIAGYADFTERILEVEKENQEFLL